MKRFQPRGDRRLGKQDRRQVHVLYEDDAVVVLNKRAKLLAVPADDSDTPSALCILSAELKSKRQRADRRAPTPPRRSAVVETSPTLPNSRSSQNGATNYRIAVARVTLRRGESSGAE